MNVLWTIKLFLLISLTAQAVEWSFTTPPSAIKRIIVNEDWRNCADLTIDLTVAKAPKSSAPVFCTVFFETKQDWWFESSVALDIRKPGNHRFKLSLVDGTGDWHCDSLRRGFGPDVLRWVKCWGIKVFSTQPSQGVINLGDIQFSEISNQSISISPLPLPKTAPLNRVIRPTFVCNRFRGNPFDARVLKAEIIVKGPQSKERLPAFFVQEYIRQRPPYQEKADLVPYDKPRWQAVWVPRVAGKYSLKAVVQTLDGEISADLGEVDINSRAPVVSFPQFDRPDDSYDHSYKGPLILQSLGTGWTQPPPDVDTRLYIHRQLDWTPAWGNYVGAGEFDQRQAWLLGEWLDSQAESSPRPLLIFSEDELDEQGVYNWKDNPLNRQKNGALVKPAEFFSSTHGRELVKNRARYFWSRYGHHDAVSGLLILINRPHDNVVSWVNSIAEELHEEFPGLRLFCNNPGLQERIKVIPLHFTKRWTTDPRLARNTYLSRDLKDDSIGVSGRYPGSTAILFDRQIQHWCGADAFAVDVQTSEAAGNEVKVMCSIRVDKDTVFQSQLKWLREADWNRVIFPLNDPEAWACYTKPGRKLSPWDFLNVHDVSLRFFCDQPNHVVLDVRNPHLLFPTRDTLKSQPPIAISTLKEAPTAVDQYQLFELNLDINRLFTNPYNPEEVKLDLHLVSPTGKQILQPGFFYEPWKLVLEKGLEVTVRDGTPFWKVRFTPWETGEYIWKAIVHTNEGHAQVEGTFECNPAKSRGFVRRSQDNNYLEFSNGDFFYPIGHNLRSPSDRRPGIYQSTTLANANAADRLGTHIYDVWFRKMRKNGENFTRLWMSPWWLGIEWTPRTPGYYGAGYYNQENAARLDRILDMAAKNQIYINLETANHGILSTHIDAEWQYHPYNKRNHGGFLTYATDFFTNPRARAMDRRKMRYTAARWGHSTSVAIWGLMTEVEWAEAYFRGFKWAGQLRHHSYMPRPYYTERYRPSVLNWMRTAGQYLRATDAHPHIITTHLSNPHHGLEFWGQPDLQVVHNNAYTSFTGMWQKERFQKSNGVADVIHEFDRYFSEISNKPRMIGEWGGHHKRNTETQLKTELHTGIWSMFMTNCLGTTGYWWWNLIDAHDLYPHFKALAAFAQGEDRRGLNLKTAKVDLHLSNHQTYGRWQRQGLLLYNRTRLYAYLYPTAINLKVDGIFPGSSNDPRFPESGNGYLLMPSTTRSGTYAVEYWDTFKGRIISTMTATITKKNQRLPIPSHLVDLAVKVKLIKASATDETEDYERPEPVVEAPEKPEESGVFRELWFVDRPYLQTFNWSKKPEKTEILESFEIPRHSRDHYAERLTARVTIPKTGSYRFYIASDDESRLEISYSGKERDLKKVASVADWVHSNEWTRTVSQKSKPVHLREGAAILIRAYHVERFSGDHLSVAWSLNGGPVGIIPSKHCHPSQ